MSKIAEQIVISFSKFFLSPKSVKKSKTESAVNVNNTLSSIFPSKHLMREAEKYL